METFAQPEFPSCNSSRAAVVEGGTRGRCRDWLSHQGQDLPGWNPLSCWT